MNKCEHKTILFDRLSDEDEGLEYCGDCGFGLRDLNYEESLEVIKSLEE